MAVVGKTGSNDTGIECYKAELERDRGRPCSALTQRCLGVTTVVAALVPAVIAAIVVVTTVVVVASIVVVSAVVVVVSSTVALVVLSGNERKQENQGRKCSRELHYE